MAGDVSSTKGADGGGTVGGGDGGNDVDRDTSDRVSDAMRGDPAPDTDVEPTVAERAQSQARMEAENAAARDRIEKEIAGPTTSATPAGPIELEDEMSATVTTAAPTAAAVTLAQATTTAPAVPDVSLPAGLGKTLRAATPAGLAVAASVGLQSLTQAAANNRIADAGRTLGLDMTTVEGVLGANAYASAKETMSAGYVGQAMTGLNYNEVPTTGPVREAAARAIARNEMANPGDWAGATMNRDPAAKDRVQRAIDGAVMDITTGGIAPDAGAPLDLSGIALERTSAVDPALSASSTRARGLLAPHHGMQNWRAHHVIPYAEVARLPVAAQQAMVSAGWRMDSLENLAALPADPVTYTGPPNNQRLPIHSGAHPVYSARIGASLQTAATTFATMSPAEIRAELAAIEAAGRAMLVGDRIGMHPVIR